MTVDHNKDNQYIIIVADDKIICIEYTELATISELTTDEYERDYSD